MLESIEKLHVPFQFSPPNNIEKRKCLLKNLCKMLTDHENDFIEALTQDLGKCRFESIECEILSAKVQICSLLDNLDSWTTNKKLSRTFYSLMDTCMIQRQPYGLVLIISPWNYPVYLFVCPLAGAIAAGNSVVVKPSELAPATEQLFLRLLPKFLDEDTVCIFTGGVAETKDLLDRQRFDFIFYTGGTNAGRSIMGQAAKNLTPIALELGGKSPVYLDANVNMELAAKRIISAKFINAGQTCVAPDYVLCHTDVLDEFIAACKKALVDFYGTDAHESKDYGRIINSRHTQRLCQLLKETSGKVAVGGSFQVLEKFIEPTIIINVDKSDVLMEDEIFGPILPVMTVESSDEAISYVNSREKALAIYVYSSDDLIKQKWSDRTTSGSLTFNDSVFQLSIPNLPFGGVGNSGMGRYFGKASLKLFSNPRSICDRSKFETINNRMRYPPFADAKKENWIRWALSTSQDSSSSSCCIS